MKNKTFKEYLTEKIKEILHEGLIMTYSPTKAVSIIKRKYPDFFIEGVRMIYRDIRNDKSDSTFPLNNREKVNNSPTIEGFNSLYCIKLYSRYAITKDDLPILNNIAQTLNACGWYFAGIISGYEIVKKLDVFKDPCMILYEPRFDQNATNEIVGDTLYHICPLKYVPKILKNGLQPKQGERKTKHLERLYLFVTEPDDWHYIAEHFKESRKDEPYALLKVNVKNLKDRVKFYYDSNVYREYPKAVYTYEPIPNNVIEVVDYEQ